MMNVKALHQNTLIQSPKNVNTVLSFRNYYLIDNMTLLHVVIERFNSIFYPQIHRKITILAGFSGHQCVPIKEISFLIAAPLLESDEMF